MCHQDMVRHIIPFSCRLWLCWGLSGPATVFDIVTWLQPQRHALLEVESISQETFAFFSCASRHEQIFSCLMKCMWAFCTWIFVHWCVYLYICLCDPNDAFFLYSIWLSARCWWLSETPAPPPPPNLAEIGHFSVSGQTIHVGTR